MVYFPLGFRSASTGVFSPIRVKSSMFRSMLAAWAMARRWSTAFVEPPRAVITVMAFSKDFFVRMSEGLISFSNNFNTARPAASQSCFLSFEMASWAELPGRLRPRASIAEAMVLAVYIPPQAPGPGIESSSIFLSSASSIFPPACEPTASKTETMSTSFSLCFPGMMVPP